MTAPEPAVSEELFMARVADIRAADPSLTPVGAGLLAALHLGVCTDSRSFARILSIAHALVLREVTDLSDCGLLSVLGRNERTQRTTLALTDKGRRIAAAPWTAPREPPRPSRHTTDSSCE